MRVVIFVLLGLITLTSCSGGGAPYVFYVVIKPDDAGKFIGAVTTIAKEDGLETAMSQRESDSGIVLRVVEGRSHALRLWAQNALQSGHEDPNLCGAYSEPHPDPAQFIVFTEPRFFGSNAAATDLGERVLSQLHKAGFDVRREPAICGAAALHDRA